ncbi:SET domain-containing protein [Dictyostelium discoideum AX4]|uniref:SET domain-containing protein n=1 Tax=Dictyostelium discoideum TaxID=44689 RepID=B0G148_DICDI|nr:SET domain-containing protein [Dictyostelium discoideum AX4]EDR41059.1 SET domain-containing protein [Dictyostelium discoideum AX4]|eukprot:XP_001733010.1 SET domain-containing protein [Dictyostelium discoideum AX4]
MTETTTSLREIGNKFFKEKRLNLAIENYNKAIEFDPSDYQSYTNRSLAYFQKKEYENSLEDSKEAIKINPQWDKAHYRYSMALKQFNRLDESLRSLYIIYNRFYNSTNNNNTTTSSNSNNIDINLITKEIDNIQKLLISNRYSKDIISQSETFSNSINANVKVDYINANLGKSVFLIKDITNYNQPLISENPLVSNLSSLYFDENYKSCFHCLKSIFVNESCYGEKMKKQKELFIEKPSFTCDKNCKFEVYCSENCKNEAWKQYHNLLCPNYDLILKLYGFCRIKNQIFPLVIMKMLAIVLNDLKNNKKSLEDSLSPFTSFQYDLSDSILSDDQLIAYAFIIDIFKSILKEKNDEIIFNQLINKERYYQFNSILKLNSSDVQPLSILEELIDNKVSKAGIKETNIKIGDEVIEIDSIGEFLEKNKLPTISIKGVGLYRVINSINHSCEPNVFCSFSKNDHSMTIYPTPKMQLKKGQEINISYINEDLPFSQRQKLLKENYSFNCNCKKCKNKE